VLGGEAWYVRKRRKKGIDGKKERRKKREGKKDRRKKVNRR
jgi:hypothetical protein